MKHIRVNCEKDSEKRKKNLHIERETKGYKQLQGIQNKRGKKQQTVDVLKDDEGVNYLRINFTSFYTDKLFAGPLHPP